MSKKGEDRLYVRVSTLKDSQKDSPEHQQAFIREHAARMGIYFSDNAAYEDRDSASSIVARDDVQRMIADAKRGEISSLWFTSLSRFSRDALDAISLKRILVNALKIRVVSIEDAYDSGVKDDELLFGIKSVVNQNTSGDISVSSRRGIRQSAIEGNFTGSIPPFGYKKVVVPTPMGKKSVRKTLEVIPEQAEVVKLIFDLYVNKGLGEKSIVNYLNGDGGSREPVPSYKGGLWGLSSVQRVLTNENYTGFTVFGRHTVEVAYNDLNDLMDRGKKLVQKPKEEWERTQFQTHEVIISKELYDQAQELRLIRGGGVRGGRRAFVNVFAKMAYCAECGAAMVTMSTLKRNKQYRYLMCSRRRRIGEVGCSNGRWIEYFDLKDDLIEEILKIIRKIVKDFNRHGIKSVEAKLPKSGYDKDISKHEKKIADNRKLLFEIRRQHMLGEIDTEQYNFEKEQYEKEIEEVTRKLQLLEASQKQVLNVEKNVKEMQLALKELTSLKSYDDVDKTRALLLKVVRRIEIDKNGETIVQTII
ncbi:recombinase family protein [Paenibacillus sp. CF384]|uniref:recombinase family protein n=1 Tax=Paenibacillus sp. CF384 TaxID=1884382 RepID=UPI000897783B|nr:recombinase family protein [Paenibacillus sp. CF384]SDW79564.1 Site-specific DNA recombinase [Paenibacillus sp. CF384]